MIRVREGHNSLALRDFFCQFEGSFYYIGAGRSAKLAPVLQPPGFEDDFIQGAKELTFGRGGKIQGINYAIGLDVFDEGLLQGRMIVSIVH